MTTLDYARRYVAAGLSVIPIAPDGSKAPPPGFQWNPFRERVMAAEELERWWNPQSDLGIAVVCGGISGGLLVLDFDRERAFTQWWVGIGEGLREILTAVPIASTPKGGRHVYLRVSDPGRNRKLAKDAAGTTLIETRAEGGYVLAPGSPASCGSTHTPYTWQQEGWLTNGLADH